MTARTEPEAAGKRGEVIAVISAKGGIGRTVLTINLAVALSKNNMRVAILDGDYQFGDVCLAMDLSPSFTIKDAVEAYDSLDRHALAGYLMHHGSGVRVLAAPERPEYADLIKPAQTAAIVDLLAVQHDYVIVDTGVGLNETTLQFIDKADQLLLMTTMEMASVKKTKSLLDTLELLGVTHKVQVVLNRSTMDSVIKAHDVADLLGVEQTVYIPNDFALVSGSLNTGIPLILGHGKSDLAKALFKMAEQLVSRREIAVFRPKSQSLLGQLFHRGKGTVKTLP